MRPLVSGLATLLLVFSFVPTPAFAYTYTAADFGPDTNGNVWDIWSATGSNVWDWSHDYVDGYLHYSFKVLNYSGDSCNRDCRMHIVWDTDPTFGFEIANTIERTTGHFPETLSNNHTYQVDVRWHAGGYRVTAYDETSGTLVLQHDVAYPAVTSTMYDAYITYRNWTDSSYVESTPAEHAALFSPYVQAMELTGAVSGGGNDIRTTARPVMQGVQAPSVLFIPGLKGSVLKTGSDTLWPPAPDFFSSDVQQLALTDSGDSVNPVVVDGIIETFYTVPIYSGFVSFMDELVASGTTTAWRALPYDWRFSPERILADGIQTPSGLIDPVEQVEELATLSGTGKVVIVAHSMGGLLGKALIKKLESEGKADLVESFVMIGTPQLGTPQAALALLHGDSLGIFSDAFLVNPAILRTVSQNFQSAHDLLPSSRYFDGIIDPVFKFSTTSTFTQPWRDFWGNSIGNYDDFVEFLTGNGVARVDPGPGILTMPEILRTDLIGNARTFHETYDNYVIPGPIRVVQVAGWGIPTVKGIEYKNVHFFQSYVPLFTREGDKTVLYPSALSELEDEAYFLDLSDYNDFFGLNAQHRDLLAAEPVLRVLQTILESTEIVAGEFLSETKPSTSEAGDKLIVSTHSPVILGTRDQENQFTGISPNQDLEAELLMVTEDIPGGVFLSSGNSQYIFLPKEGTYDVAFTGIGSGPTTLQISSFVGDVQSLLVSYTDIPVATGTVATFSVDSTASQNTKINLDSNGDGDADLIYAPDGTDPPITELFALLKQKISVLNIKESWEKAILKKINDYEKKVIKIKNKKVLKAIDSLLRKILQKLEKSSVSDVDTQEVSQLIVELGSKL